MKRFRSLCTVVACVWVGACGSGVNSPTTPSTPTAMSITPTTGVLVVGQTQPYTTANGTANDTIAWSSTDSTVLTIDSTGNATAVGKGVVTITAAGTTQSATLQVQVVPNYQGTWTGNTVNVACTSISGFDSYCAQGGGSGQAIGLSLTQSALVLSGVLTKAEPGGSLSGAVNGLIGPGGDITLRGTLTGVSNGANISSMIISWNSLATGNTMTGSWATNVTSPQILGIATVQWSLRGMTLSQ